LRLVRRLFRQNRTPADAPAAALPPRDG
jgi:hypothetical protein